MNPLYNELLATLNLHGPQRLEERLVGLDTATMRTLIADMHIEREGSPRDQLRQHFGLNTYASGMPLGQRVEREDTPLPTPSPIIEPSDPINPDPSVVPNEVPTPPRPWGSVTSDSQIWGLIGRDNLMGLDRQIHQELIKFYRLMAHHTGPTSLNKAIIEMTVKNARDNALLSPNTKMVRDMDIVEAVGVLRSADPRINSQFPNNHVLPSKYIYKKGSQTINIACLDTERFAGHQITANHQNWTYVTAAYHMWHFLYKRDPSVAPLAELQLKISSARFEIGAYIPNAAISGGLGLSKIEGHSLDEFNGRIIAETRDGPVAMHDPQFLYHPKFQHEEVVKTVRDRETKRKLLPAYMCRALNRPMKIDRIKLYAGKIHYDTIAYTAMATSDGGYRPSGVRNVNGVPEELLIKAGRTKAFGSI